jgi:membrane protein
MGSYMHEYPYTLRCMGGECGERVRNKGQPNTPRIIQRRVRLFAGLQRQEIVAVLKETLSEWSSDKAPRLGASLAFYTPLSLAPLLVVIVAVAAFAYGQQAAQGQLVCEIQDLVGPDRARAIQALIQNAYKPGTGLIATVLGLLTLMLGASSVVAELQDALNTVWHVPPSRNTTGLSGFIHLVKERCYSFGLVLGVGFLLLASLVLNAWLAAMGRFFGSFLPTPEFILQVGAFLVSFLVITLLFAAIYKFLPEVPLTWSDVIVGASVTSFLFTIGKQLIGIYLGKTTLGSTYGAAGSLVLVLVWVYYSAQLFFLGAEFTNVYTKARISSGERGRTGFSQL